jgi:hypothetical protein
MKKSLYIFLLLLACAKLSSAQETDRVVTLTVTGTGKTPDEAKTNALRSAIEQAFGAFISSKTEILNDAVVKDEIVSVANGNIQKFDIISEVQIPEGGYAASLKATVSVTKLSTFAESKGVAVEFKGGVFAANILMQELYEKNEITALQNCLATLSDIAQKSFDYTIKADEPYATANNWTIPLTVDVFTNKNFLNIPTLLEQTLRSLSLSDAEVENYKKLNKAVYPVTLATSTTAGVYYFRKNESRIQILDFIYELKNAIHGIYISNGVTKKSIFSTITKRMEYSNADLDEKEIKIDETNFKIIAGSGYGYGGLIDGMGLYKFENTQVNSYRLYFKLMHKKGSVNLIDIYCSGAKQPQSFSKKQYTIKNNFLPLTQVMYSKLERTNYGLVISFAGINAGTKVVQFKFEDIKTLDEIKQITKYEIQKTNK